MLASLGRINNPWVRSLTAAFTLGSTVAIASSIAISVTHSNDKSAHQFALYSSLIGAGSGAIFGLIYINKRSNEKRIRQIATGASTSQSREHINWKDWRNFVVIRKVQESEEITSFYLQPEDNGEIPQFQPGQFLTIKLDIPGQTKPIIRTYSLSDYPDPQTYYRLSIKREPTPRGLEVPPGIASNFMHDQIHVGSVIPAKPPSGKFVLDLQKTLPAVLISNGVGITPMISMAKAATGLNPDRPLWFIHGARDGRFHAFREEMLELTQHHPNLTVHFVYSRPRPDDEGHYHSTGYADSALIQSLVQQEAEYFLCGSPPFMDSIREGLKNTGVPDSRVFFEMFTKAPKAPPERPSAEVLNSNVTDVEVVFSQSNKTVTWSADSGSLLDFAEANDLNPPYSCRQGICGTCQCKILEGEVEYQDTPTANIDDGSVLICISKPKTARLVLDL